MYEFGQPDPVAKVYVIATGQAGFGLAMSFPFFAGVQAVPFTETRVCDELKAKVEQFLSIEGSSENTQSGESNG